MRLKCTPSHTLTHLPIPYASQHSHAMQMFRTFLLQIWDPYSMSKGTGDLLWRCSVWPILQPSSDPAVSLSYSHRLFHLSCWNILDRCFIVEFLVFTDLFYCTCQYSFTMAYDILECVLLVSRGWLFDKNFNQWTSMNIWAYKMVLLRLLYLFFMIVLTCRCLRIAAREGVWDRKVGENDRQVEMQTLFFKIKTVL